MQNLTTWEKRQRAYFACGREIRKAACELLDDVREHAELVGATARWALNNAVLTAKKANEMDELAYAEGIASNRQISDRQRSGDQYSKALDTFRNRLATAREIEVVEANELMKSWLAPRPGLRGPDYTTGPDRDESPRDVYTGEELEL